MAKNLFNAIAPFYGLFYNFQVRYYQKVLEKVKPRYDLARYQSIVDIGCGTGALCRVLQARGMTVTGVDSAGKMLAVAAKKLAHTNVRLIRADAHKPTPLPGKSFDIAISAYTAHGMPTARRQALYREMNRLARHLVIFHDFNKYRSIIIDTIEKLEGSDYLNFIENAAQEMSAAFKDVVVFNVGLAAAWYVCTPKLKPYFDCAKEVFG